MLTITQIPINQNLDTTTVVDTNDEIITYQSYVPDNQGQVVSQETIGDYTIEQVVPTLVEDNKDQEHRVEYSNRIALEPRRGSGEQVLNFENDTCDSIYETIEFSDGEITNTNCSDIPAVTHNDAQSYAVTKDGKIIYANQAIVTTLGGIDYIGMIYPSLEDADNQTNGVPINGSAQEGSYFGTEEYNNQYFASVTFSALNGYMNLDEVQIVPIQLVETQSYYEAKDGDWVYNIAIDPLDASKGYESYPLGEAPDFAQEGQKYYSNDGETFHLEQKIINSYNIDPSSTPELRNATYFQNLPVRSTSLYTGTQYKTYLNNKGFTNSVYYNHTNEFVNMQDEHNLNSLMLFAWANHESKYGTSNLANDCNNFYGWNAPDSAPGTCQNNPTAQGNYADAKSGIRAHGFNIPTHFLNVSDWRYAGSHPGTKASGLNYKYASDVNWGSKVASHAYSIDSSLGSLESNLFRIGRLNKTANVYAESDLKDADYIYASSGSLSTADAIYKIKVGGLNSSFSGQGINVLITDTQSGSRGSATEIQLDTALNSSGSELCSVTHADYGTYPLYDDQYYNNEGLIGAALFSCNYEWQHSRSWIYSSNIDIIHDNPMFPPGGVYESKPILKNYSLNIDANSFGLTPGDYVVKNIVQDKGTGKVLGYEVFKDPMVQTETGYVKVKDAKFINYKPVYKNTATSIVNIRAAANTSSNILYAANVNEVFVVEQTVTGETINCGQESSDKWLQVTLDNNTPGFVSSCFFTDEIKGSSVSNNIKKYSLKEDILHVEGVAYTRYMPLATGGFNYALTFSDGTNFNEIGIGKSKRPWTLEGFYNRDGTPYDYGYYATAGYKGVSLSTLPIGDYQVGIQIKKDGYTFKSPLRGNTAINGDKIETQVDGYKYTLELKNNAMYLEKVSLIPANPRLSTSIKKIWLKDSTFHIEGAAFIKYLETTSYNARYKVRLFNQSDNYEYSLAASNQSKKMAAYKKRDGIDYSHAYVATKGYKGIDIGNIKEGTYDLELQLNHSGHSSIWTNAYIGIKDKTITQTVGGYEYKVIIKSNNVKISKKKIIPDNPRLATSIKDIWLEGSTYHIEGAAFIKNLETTSYNARYKMRLFNENDTYNYSLAASNQPKKMEAYKKRDGVDYSHAYVATRGYKGIDISNIAEGTYNLQLQLSHYGHTSIWTDAYIGLKNQTISQRTGGYEYKVIINNNNVKISKTKLVPDNPRLATSIKNIWLDGSTFHMDGAAFIKYLDTTSYNARYKLRLYNQNNTYNYSLAASNQPKKMEVYKKRDQTDYSHAYVATKGYKGIDISNIAEGTYSLQLQLTHSGYTSIWTSAYIGLKDQTITQTAGGYDYKVIIKGHNVTISKAKS